MSTVTVERALVDAILIVQNPSPAALATAIGQLRLKVPQVPQPPTTATFTIPDGGSSDANVNLQTGESLAFTGRATNTKTVNCRDNCVVRGSSSVNAVIRCPTNAIRIPDTVRNVTVSEVAADVADKIRATVSCSGDNCTVTNITAVGLGRILQLDGVNKFRARHLKHTNGAMRDYGVYLTDLNGTVANKDVWLEDIDIVVPVSNKEAQHGIRGHGCFDLVIRRGTIKYFSEYGGSTITIKNGKNLLIDTVDAYGPMGFGPLKVDRENKVAGWETKVLDGIHIRKCNLYVYNYLAFGPSTKNVLVEECTVRAVRRPTPGSQYDINALADACLDLSGPAGPNGEWVAPNGTFKDCTFAGGELVTIASRPQLGRWSFVNCTFNGKPVGTHGETTP